jgi:hypothetical protein
VEGLVTSASQLCFTPDLIGNYRALLEVSDGEFWCEHPDEAMISVEGDVRPTAVIDLAGGTGVDVNEEVCLDGSESYDPEGDGVTYSWDITFNSGSATLTATDGETTCFTPDVAGDYVVQLIVTDTHGQQSEPETVTITANDPPAPIAGDLDGDGIIDASDQAVLFGAFGSSVGSPAYVEAADYDGDGWITYADYSIWYGHYLASLN